MSLARYLSKITQLLNSSGQVLTGGIADSAVTIGKVDTSVSQLFGMRNRIINGDMRIDQRNAGASVSATNGFYCLDRYYTNSFTSGATTGKFTVQRNAGSVTPPTGFTNYLGVTSTAATSSSAGDIYAVAQVIEGYNIADLAWGTANAKSVTLSFWVRSSATGTFGIYIRNLDNTYNYPTTYTISSANTWEYKTVSIPAPTSGTWNATNDWGIGVYFQLQVGSSFTATPDIWTTAQKYGATGCVNLLNNNGATFYITGVQLEKGSVATPFEHRLYGAEELLCHRYYQKLTNFMAQSANAAVDTMLWWSGVFPTQMRATPTASINAAFSVEIPYDAIKTQSSPAIGIGVASGVGCELQFGNFTGLVYNRLYRTYPGQALVFLSAEL